MTGRNHARVLPAAAAALAITIAGCDATQVQQAEDEPLFSAGGGAVFERAWGNDIQWELVKPRPPGIGAAAHVVTHAYQVAPQDPASPLSPPFVVPGMFAVGGRDHVFTPPPGNGGQFTAVARTVPVMVPGWNPSAPYDEAACAPDLGAYADRIAWDWVDPAPVACGRAPLVLGVRLDGEACILPLTSTARIQAAASAGLVELSFPPEPPWPFALRLTKAAGHGRAVVAAPGCLSPGQRGAGG